MFMLGVGAPVASRGAKSASAIDGPLYLYSRFKTYCRLD